MNRCLSNLRIDGKISLFVCYLNISFDPDNRLLLNLQLGQLNASCELGIIKSALPVCGEGNGSLYPQILLLHRPQLLENDRWRAEACRECFCRRCIADVSVYRTCVSTDMNVRNDRTLVAVKGQRERL